MPELTAEQIKEIAANKANINLTLHVLDRLRERGIAFADVVNVLMNGEIIEQYPDDYPFPSCLELGASVSGKALHVCCGVSDNKIWIITTYYPKNDKWENNFRTRKAVE